MAIPSDIADSAARSAFRLALGIALRIGHGTACRALRPTSPIWPPAPHWSDRPAFGIVQHCVSCIPGLAVLSGYNPLLCGAFSAGFIPVFFPLLVGREHTRVLSMLGGSSVTWRKDPTFVPFSPPRSSIPHLRPKFRNLPR
jgi:hypothetical protein